jgi:hypothetical protein
MNKLGYQPLTVIMKAESSDSGWPSHSAKLLRVAAALGALFVLCGVAALCLTGFGLLTPGTTGTKQSPEVRVLPATTASPAPMPDQDAGIGASIPETKQPQPLTGTGTSDDAIVVQSPTPVPNSLPVSASLVPEARRKSLEKTRRAAERQRSRLEANYQKHAISSEVYKEGVEKYRAEIEKYRKGMNPAKGPNNESGF